VIETLRDRGMQLPQLSRADFTLTSQTMDFLPLAFREQAPVMTRKDGRRRDAQTTLRSESGVTKSGPGTPGAPRLYVVGDSFYGAWLQYTSFLFSDVYHSTNITGAYPLEAILSVKPDAVVYEIVERYLNYPIFLNGPMLQGLSFSAISAAGIVENGGYVDGISIETATVAFNGWALHPDTKLPPRSISVFLGDSEVAAVAPVYDRGDIAANAPSKRVGFTVSIPKEIWTEDRKALRLIAIYADKSYGKLNVDVPQKPKLAQLGLELP
jgi:hypothetical protein